MLKAILAAYSFKRMSVQKLYEKQLEDAKLELAQWQHQADFANGNVEMLTKRVARLVEAVNANA